jgi:hypothetical protein
LLTTLLLADENGRGFRRAFVEEDVLLSKDLYKASGRIIRETNVFPLKVGSDLFDVFGRHFQDSARSHQTKIFIKDLKLGG